MLLTSKTPLSRRLSNLDLGAKKAYDFIALHHFPVEFLKADGNRLLKETIPYADANNLGLRLSDQFELRKDLMEDKRFFNDTAREHDGKYIIPPMLLWDDIVSNFEKAGG